MDRLKVDELLRYAYSGGVAFFALCYVFPNVPVLLEKYGGPRDASLIVGFALVVGCCIYVLHRSVFFPVIKKLLAPVFTPEIPRSWSSWGFLYYVHRAEFKSDQRRWAANRDESSGRNILSEWGAQVHFLYCAAWSLCLGLLFGSNAKWAGSADAVAYRHVQMLIGVFLVAALIHHARLLAFERHLSR